MMIRSEKEKGLSGEADQAENNLETESASFSLAQPGRAGDLTGIPSQEMEPILQLRYNQINAETILSPLLYRDREKD